METAYEFFDVTEDNFGELFYKIIKTDSEAFIQRNIFKTHLFRYLLNYLRFHENGLKVETIIKENNYTCLNFLEDYANYYARCYTLYEKHCKRIHFFQIKFDEKCFFEEMLKDPDHVNWKMYAGCMVIKPLPKGIFGITYLKPYARSEEKKRYYTCLSKKTINLFGHDCEIETMPFKEQDGVVASCATTALWVAFQKTSELFHTKAPSLSEITILAGNKDSTLGKTFPSKALGDEQICKAIYNNGLMPELYSPPSTKSDFCRLIYAYLKGGIPVLLYLRPFSQDTKTSQDHLVTINGYRLGSSANTDEINYTGRGCMRFFRLGSSANTVEINYRSDEIIRFYAHDDQTGPFSKLIIENYGNDGSKLGSRTYPYIIKTSWWTDDKKNNWRKSENFFEKTEDSEHGLDDSFIRAFPLHVIIPITRTIKIRYEVIQEQQWYIADIMKNFMTTTTQVTWDIFIIKSNEYKKMAIKGSWGQEEMRKKLLTTSFPQYIWVIQAWAKDTLLFDFIYDTVELNIAGRPVAINMYFVPFVDVLLNPSLVEKDVLDSFSVDKYKGSFLHRLNDKTFDNATEES